MAAEIKITKTVRLGILSLAFGFLSLLLLCVLAAALYAQNQLPTFTASPLAL